MSAIAVKGGKVLSVGFNHLKQFSALYYGTSTHAEEDCIKHSTHSLEGAKILVYRFARKDGELKISKPCPRCYAALSDCGVSYVLYTDRHGEVSKMRIGELDKRTIVLSRLNKTFSRSSRYPNGEQYGI